MFYNVLNLFFVSHCSCANHKHLQGEEAKNIPGETMTEEHYMDHDGNLVSRKVMYNLICSEKKTITGRVAQCFCFFLKQTPSDLFFFPLSSFFCLGQVIRKVIRRVSTPTPENQRSDRWHRDVQHSPILQEEVGMKIAFNCVPGFKI